MYYVIQENIFREENYNNLILSLNKLNFSYEIVKILPFTDEIKLKTKRTDIFPFGALKIAEISKKYGWKPGSQMNSNHDFLVYKNFYKDNLLNYNSRIIKFGDINFFNKELFFARPTKDSKVFTGRVFDMSEWQEFRDISLINGHSTTLNKDTEIQISNIKKIQQEIRFWIVKGKIITASQYRLGNRLVLNNIVDEKAYIFCNKMIKLFELNDAFVMDICLSEDNYKIIECGCINCAGFYRADLQKLLIALEDNF